MIRRQKPHDNSGEIDEHDQPTEPIAYDPAFPFDPTAPGGMGQVYDETLPAPMPPAQPFPQRYVPGVAQYPFLPPAPPIQQGNRPAGGAMPVGPGQGVKGGKAERRRLLRRSPVPALVGLFFVLVQLLLLARFVLKIINLPSQALWMEIVYALSELFIWPVRLLVQQVHLPFSLWAEVYTLLAILLYGILSRILVRILKAILHRR